MREFRTYGSVRGVPGNRHPYRDRWRDLLCFERLMPFCGSFSDSRIGGKKDRSGWNALQIADYNKKKSLVGRVTDKGLIGWWGTT